MKKYLITPGIFLVLILSRLYVPHLYAANLEWSIKNQLDLKGPPLDISASLDGQWIFILAPGEISVYSIADDKVIKRIPVDKDFDKVIHSTRNNTLLVSSRSENIVKIIQLELIQDISISGLPIRGPEQAPVTIAVFSDYQ